MNEKLLQKRCNSAAKTYDFPKFKMLVSKAKTTEFADMFNKLYHALVKLTTVKNGESENNSANAK